MKNKLFKSGFCEKLKLLLIPIGLLIGSLTTQVWAWSQVSLRGDMKGIGWDPGYRWTDETGSGSTETYAAYGDGFKLYVHGQEWWVGYCEGGTYSASSLTSDGSHSHLYNNYGGKSNQNVTYIGCNGIVSFNYSNNSDATNNNPDVWITRPTIYLKNSWGESDWSWESTTDEGNGYYYVDANLGADGVNWGTNGSSAWQKNSTDVYITASTKYPSSISAGTKVRYRLNTNPSGDSWDAATPTLTIHKILTITYYDNGKTSGTKPENQEAPHSIASTLATNSGNMAKTGYVFTGWNTQADGKGTHYDAGASITITANTDLYAEWNRKWAVQGSGTEMGAWSKFNYLAPTGNANEFSGTIDLAANTTYVFKLRNREDNSLWGYGDGGTYQLAYIGQSSAHAHNLESTDGKKDLVLMSANSGTYTFTYNQSTKRLTVGFPSQTHPNTNNIYFKNSGNSPYSGVCINIYGGATDGVSGWERMPSIPSCTIDGQTYYYSAIGDNTKCKFANAANSGTNTGEKTDIQSKKGKYYDLATNTWKSFVFDITYKDQGNVAFSGTHNDSPSTHPTTHTFGSSTSLNTASKTGYTFSGWFTNSSCTGSSVSTLSATGYTADITLYAKWTEITHTVTLGNDGNGHIEIGGETVTSVSGVGISTASGTITATANTGYHFDSWTGDIDDGVTIASGEGTYQITINATADSKTITATFAANTYELTLDSEGGSSGSGTVTMTYNSSSHTAITNPSKDGYDFAGWYDGDDGAGNLIIDTDGTVQANKSDLTGAGGIWIKDGTPTLHAKWTESTYAGRLVEADGSTVHGSYEVTYNDTKITITSEPSKAGYEVEGYYKEYDPKLDVQVAEEDGDLLASRTYTDAEHKWIYSSAPDLYINWKGKQYTIILDRQGGTTGSTSFTVTMGHNDYSAITIPTRAGYEFEGYYTNDVTPVLVIQANGNKNTGTTYINGDGNWVHPNNITLYAHWTPVALSFVGGEGESRKVWSTASNWSPACVPTIEHDVTINAETTISGSAVAKSVTIGGSGKVTIEATGVLEVEGTVTNTDDSKLIINTSSSSQGALIYDITTAAPSATINMTMSYTGGNSFQYIASPVGGARVSSMFSGKGVYTYAWIEGKGWERRGYYDDFMGNEVIVINGQGSCIFSGLLCPSTSGSLAYTATPEDASAQGVNMIPNTLTAPIKIAAMSFSGSSDNGVHIWEDGSWHGYAPASTQAATAVIPALQGYAVLAESGGSVSFNYTDAVRGTSSHNDALRAPKRVIEDTPDYMTISVITNERKVDLQLSEHAQFTTAIDKGWETIYMEGDGRFGQLYALADEKMSILATPDLEGTVLGFVPGEILNYTLSFEGDGKGYYLNDIEEQQSTLIEEGNTYTFSSGNNNAARFIVSRTPINKIATGVDAVSDGVKAHKQMIDGVLYIIRDGRMYNAEGMLVK